MKNFAFKRYPMARKSKAQGFVLLDAMIAILIFSFGILGMVALQSSAIQLTSNANYRMSAAILADQIIAQMWTDPTNVANGGYATGGTQYKTWLATVECGNTTSSPNCLPGAAGNPPTIVIGTAASYNGTNPNYPVTITINWQAQDGSTHSYESITQIGQ